MDDTYKKISEYDSSNIYRPGMQVKVVNSYAATSDLVVVMLESKVDLPTLGNPIIHTLAFPYRDTSNPSAKYY